MDLPLEPTGGGFEGVPQLVVNDTTALSIYLGADGSSNFRPGGSARDASDTQPAVTAFRHDLELQHRSIVCHGKGNGDGFRPWSGVTELSDGTWRAIYEMIPGSPLLCDHAHRSRRTAETCMRVAGAALMQRIFGPKST